ncbi:MAG: hypothetical protein ACE5GG_01710 [Candidatus Omnitrophota bacterium]
MNIRNHPFIKITSDDIPRAALPITIINPHTGQKVNSYGIVDTGADECAFPTGYAFLVGHNLKKGKCRKIDTGNGETTAYSHTVSMQVYDTIFKNIPVDFLPNLSIPLLGVKNFLGNFVSLIDYPRQLFSITER